MTAFRRPANAWLPSAAFDVALGQHDRYWDHVRREGRTAVSTEFTSAQNQASLYKFFLEQAFGSGSMPGATSLRIIERDFGSVESIAAAWRNLTHQEDIEWIVLALCFADFRFHLFPIGGERYPIPFCTSPVLVGYVAHEIVTVSGLPRLDFAKLQWDHLNWDIVEARLTCLSLPLDLFSEPSDCAEGVCAPVI